jgi:prevent-host-death family protein
MLSVSTYDAKATLSALLQQVMGGEEVVITRHGEPVAKLVPYPKPTWTANFTPLPEELRVRFATGEETAPVFASGIPWNPTDPV